jgi:diguanylate cyclase (GGDEF)-like protein
MLIDKNLIRMSTDNYWVYNQDEIASLTVADNVVGLMVEKIQEYSGNSITLLSTAAAIGHDFNLKTLGVIAEKTEDQIKEGILPLLQSGILIGSEQSYHFAHDGIQRAAYQITDLQNRIALHKKIGSLLLLSYKDDKSALKNNVFDICFHLNQSKHLISLDKDLDNLIYLNLMAATNAKQSAAYQAAFDYISVAVEIIEGNKGSLKHTIKFSVFREAAECSYLCGLNEEANQNITKAHLIAETNYEKCLLINLQIIQLVSMGDYVQSMALGFEGLALYNIKLPSVDDSESINAYYDKQQQLFFDSWLNKGKAISDLYNLALSNDKEIGLVMEMFGSLYASALMSYPDYLKIITIEMLVGAIKYGNTPTSPIGYAWHGSTIAAISDTYSDAYAFGQLAIRLNEEKIKNPAISCKIYNMVGNFIAFFKDPLRETNTLLRKAYELGLSSGDKLYGGYSIINELRNTLSTGFPLPQWLKLDDDVKFKLEKLDAQVMIDVRESFRAYAMQMTGQSLSAHSMDNNQFCEHAYREKYAEVPLFCALLDGWKIQSSYHLGDFKQALTLSCFETTPIDGFLLGVEYRFFAGLTLAHFLSCDTKLNQEKISRYKLYFDSYLNDIEILSNSCPENFLHLWLMLKGEQARIDNDTLLAAGYFNRAIQSAKNNEFIHYEALSHELSAVLFLKAGIKETGSAHIAQAYDLFECWGAEEKLKQLEQSFPDISFFRQPNGVHSESVSGFVGKQEITHRIDLKGIVDASLALSSEMNISLLINQLMRVALEGSGAQKGVLIQCLQGEWKIVAERSAIDHSDVVLSLPEAEERLPLSIIHYVMRTGKSVLLGDASTHDLFANDRYISEHSIKSVNCLPLVHNGKTGAILYLENNLGKNTFTQEKNQSLELLSAQMAAAIENAANYQYLYDSKQQYKVLLKSLPIGVIVHDAETRITYANPEAHRMFQTGLNDISGLVITDIEGQIYNEDGKVLEISAHPVNQVLSSGKAINNIIYGYKRPKENNPRWYMASAFPQHKQKKIESVVACYIDMTDRRENEAKIQHLAYYDTLTDLPNRTYLENTLERLIAKTLDNHQYCAIVLLDMDNFKVINDSLGHWVGDKMLQEAADRMRIHINQDSTVSQDTTIARLGGDEFVIAISSLCSNRENFIHTIETITSQVQGFFSEPFLIEGHQLNSTVSIGIAIAPDDGKNADELLRHADTALYKAKKEGRNAVCYFHREQENELHRRLEIENELRVAIESNQLRLLYQPKVDVASGDIVGAEALVRWQHPHEGTISPVEFIRIAEESGLIISLGEWVLKEACHQVKHWKEQPEFNLFQRMSVNVSPFQFNHNNFRTVVENTLCESDLNPNFLDLEVTESLLLEHIEETVEKMNYFKAMGISFSIDDFGTGYSSLAYLKRLPVDVLKVDQSFVRDMATDEGDRAIVKTVLAMASSLHLKTVAEGVETPEHLEILKKLGCLQYQGYLFSKPITAKEFEVLISTKKCAVI